MSKEVPHCPFCGKQLDFADHVRRHEKLAAGIKQWYLIERWECDACPAQKLHRVLPDFLAPHKHYNTEIITDVLNDTLQPGEEGYEDYEDYPCDKTKERWKAWMALNIIFINAYLKSVGIRLFAIGIALAYSAVDLVDELRQRERLSWLQIIIRAVYNTGSSLEPYRDPSG